MGQYFVVANLDAREYIEPASLGSWPKALEQVGPWIGVPHALMLLLGTGMSRGGGGFNIPGINNSSYLDAVNDGRTDDARQIAQENTRVIDEDPVLGRWAGHRICFIGDYYQTGDIPGVDDGELYATIMGTFNDVGPLVAPYLDVNFPSS